MQVSPDSQRFGSANIFGPAELAPGLFQGAGAGVSVERNEALTAVPGTRAGGAARLRQWLVRLGVVVATVVVAVPVGLYLGGPGEGSAPSARKTRPAPERVTPSPRAGLPRTSRRAKASGPAKPAGRKRGRRHGEPGGASGSGAGAVSPPIPDAEVVQPPAIRTPPPPPQMPPPVSAPMPSPRPEPLPVAPGALPEFM
jgi:hypothetical protein